MKPIIDNFKVYSKDGADIVIINELLPVVCQLVRNWYGRGCADCHKSCKQCGVPYCLCHCNVLYAEQGAGSAQSRKCCMG